MHSLPCKFFLGVTVLWNGMKWWRTSLLLHCCKDHRTYPCPAFLLAQMKWSEWIKWLIDSTWCLSPSQMSCYNLHVDMSHTEYLQYTSMSIKRITTAKETNRRTHAHLASRNAIALWLLLHPFNEFPLLTSAYSLSVDRRLYKKINYCKALVFKALN